MNLITDFTNGLVSKLYSPKETRGQKKSWIDIESQNMIEEPDDIVIEPKNQRVVNIFVNDEINEYDANNLVVGSGYDGYNSICWQRPTSRADYTVFYKGNKYVISYLAISKIIGSSKNKSYPIESLFKIYIENNFNIDLTIIQLTV
jgi:hypothetical protein